MSAKSSISDKVGQIRNLRQLHELKQISKKRACGISEHFTSRKNTFYLSLLSLKIDTLMRKLCFVLMGSTKLYLEQTLYLRVN